MTALTSLLIALTAAGSAVTIVLVAAGGWLWLAGCRAWPYTACPDCDALGRVMHPNGKTWRACARCAGTGRRLRWCARLRDTLRAKRRWGR